MDGIIQASTVSAIVSLVYFIIYLLRTSFGKEGKMERFIPLIAGGAGIVLGMIAYFSIPDLLPEGSNVLLAALIGGVSGLAATGTHQAYKQLTKTTTTCTTNDSVDSQDDNGKTQDDTTAS